MNLKAKVQENPVTAMIGILVLTASGLSAFGSISGIYDSSHTTEFELIASHPVSNLRFTGLENKIDEVATANKCRWLKGEKRALDDSIYVRKRDGADIDFIRLLEDDLSDLEEEYDTLNCAFILTQ